VRATVISIGSQSGALGEASAGPVVGAIGNLAGVRSALTLAALILSPALLLYAKAIRHGGAEPGLEERPARRKRELDPSQPDFAESEEIC
jgi:hypothetical protein